MPRPRVFVISEPLRLNRTTGNMVSAMDLQPATLFGDLIFIVPPGDRPPQDPEFSLQYIRPAMADYRREDFIAVIGDLAVVCWAVAIAARTTDGYVQLLRWDNRPNQKNYYSTAVNLW